MIITIFQLAYIKMYIYSTSNIYDSSEALVVNEKPFFHVYIYILIFVCKKMFSVGNEEKGFH